MGITWAKPAATHTGARVHGVAWELLPSSWRFLLRFQASLLDGVDVLFFLDSSSMNV